MHMDQAHPNQPIRAPKFEAPSIDTGVDQETWIAFTMRWEQYCKGSGISRELQSLRLFQCTTEMLGNLLLKTNPRITDCPPEVVLEEMRRLAVIRTAKGRARADLMKMNQGNDEPFRRFSARVQGKAQLCGFRTNYKCECGRESSVDYTNEVIKDVIVAGINDEGVRTRVLETEELDEKSMNEVISLVERKEESRKDHQTASIAAASSFKRQKDPSNNQPPSESPKIPCPGCQRLFRKFNGRNNKAFDVCINCFRSAKTGQSWTIRNRSEP